MRKKILTIILATALAAGTLAGCGTEKAEENKETTEEQETNEKETEEDVNENIDKTEDLNIQSTDTGQDKEHLYTISAIMSEREDEIVSAGTSETLSIEKITVWTDTELKDYPVYSDPIEYTDAESLEKDGMSLVWSVYEDPYEEINTDIRFGDDTGFETTVTYPSEGNYWVQVSLVDEKGNVLNSQCDDEVIVVG